MTYLRVTHLTVRQTYVQSACADVVVGALCPVFVQIRLLSGSDSVAICVRVMTEAVHDYKCYGFF